MRSGSTQTPQGPGPGREDPDGRLSAASFWGVVGSGWDAGCEDPARLPRPTSPSPGQKRRCAGLCKPVTWTQVCRARRGRGTSDGSDPTRTRSPSPALGSLALTRGWSPRRPPAQHAVGILPVHRLLQDQALDHLRENRREEAMSGPPCPPLPPTYCQSTSCLCTCPLWTFHVKGTLRVTVCVCVCH